MLIKLQPKIPGIELLVKRAKVVPYTTLALFTNRQTDVRSNALQLLYDADAMYSMM
jgi:hypothetical protein